MSVDRELVEILGVGLYVLDSLFLGVVDAALLMLIGRGGWLGRRPSDERVIYQARHSVLSGGIYFNLPNSIVVSDKRLTIGIAWSRAALVNVRVDAIRSVTPGRWWWRARVVVVFHERADAEGEHRRVRGRPDAVDCRIALGDFECSAGERVRETTMELCIFARFHARPGKQDAVAEALRDVVAPSSREPGCLSIHAFRSTGDPRLFYIHSRWKDEAAFETHTGLPHTVRFVERVEPLIDHALDVTRAEQI